MTGAPLAFCALTLLACTGTIASSPGATGSREPPLGPAGNGAPGDAERAAVLADPAGLGPLGTRRLSRREYADTVAFLVGVPLSPTELEVFPADSAAPFDNDYEDQLASETLVEALRTLAQMATKRALAEPARREALVPCRPQGPADAPCLRRFIETFGRRAFRRPLRPEEVSDYLGVQAFSTRTNDFYTGVGLVMQAMLQDVELLYRIESGTPVPGRPGLVRLDDFEVATRLAFLLWGTGPDDALLDAAAAGRLGTGEAVRAQAAAMLRDGRARGRVTRFFALWLGYDNLPYPAPLAAAMRRESDALVERTLFERRSPWLELFSAGDTFADETLARHYGLTPPAGGAPGWVSFGASGRRGLLSHGSFLSNGVKNGDSSPTRRGLSVRRRLMCQDVDPPPPNLQVDADAPPDPKLGECKRERYEQHDAVAACAGCHKQMDPIGFGLENWNGLGQYRAHDDGRPACLISGEGELAGVGTFRGPAELAQVLLRSERLDACFVTQLYRFSVGRHERPGEQPLLQALLARFRERHHRVDELLLELTGLPSFRHRLVEDGERKEGGP